MSNELGLVVNKVQAAHLARVTDNPDSTTVVTFTDKGEVFVNDKAGNQKKISSIEVIEASKIKNITPEEIAKLSTEKLYITNNPFNMYMYDVEKGFVDILIDIKKDQENLGTELTSIKGKLEDLNQNMEAVNEYHRTRSYKVNVSIGNLRLGKNSAIFNLNALFFDGRDQIRFNTASVTCINTKENTEIDLNVIFSNHEETVSKTYNLTNDRKSQIQIFNVGEKVSGFVEIEITKLVESKDCSLNLIYEFTVSDAVVTAPV